MTWHIIHLQAPRAPHLRPTTMLTTTGLLRMLWLPARPSSTLPHLTTMWISTEPPGLSLHQSLGTLSRACRSMYMRRYGLRMAPGRTQSSTTPDRITSCPSLFLLRCTSQRRQKSQRRSSPSCWRSSLNPPTTPRKQKYFEVPGPEKNKLNCWLYIVNCPVLSYD